jgi:hypothetical protein
MISHRIAIAHCKGVADASQRRGLAPVMPQRPRRLASSSPQGPSESALCSAGTHKCALNKLRDQLVAENRSSVRVACGAVCGVVRAFSNSCSMVNLLSPERISRI